ncbi:transmembrane 220 isoform X2 [Olea europaea subsp. europaea]|uniref:Transmembrane 220 isoform X2 n=1 Tax=Olea europaea subsp. europaea TaxID=158383 RepID=A0A8S0VFD4_OLEEU|nr:transmembrane 220 isoform X2 [Olea europaea subsp. europaea]
MAKFAVWLGMFLFIKVIIEDFVDEITGFWSFDMRERVVREKLGSGLVVGSMLMQLESLARPPHPSCTQVAKLGMPILVGISYSLSLFFFVFQHREMKF